MLKVFLIFLVCHSAWCLRLVDPVARQSNKGTQQGRAEQSPYKYANYTHNVLIDHFSLNITTLDSFSLKYLANFDYFNKDNGTIFFYTGNEGTIEGFADNTGIMWDLAPMFNAALVFAEHRYYGDSTPYGNQSYQDVKHLGYLNSIQALADFAQLIPYLKSDVLKCSPSTPVIAFGGSYGGMLTAWMRMKYPHIINGAWSGSAPLLYSVGGNIGPGEFEKVTTRTFINAGCSRDAVTKGWAAIRNLGKTVEGREILNSVFKIEEKSLLTKEEDAEWVVQFVREAIEYMAMVDYPYGSSFLEPMPAWPAKEFCKHLNDSSGDDRTLATHMYDASVVYYNYTGQLSYYCVNPTACGDTATSGLGSPLGWPWQACTEQIMDVCARGPENDMFYDECGPDANGPDEMNRKYCNSTLSSIGYNPGQMMRRGAIENLYGIDISAASNIIFTNGVLDPWSAGGIYEKSPGFKQASKNGVYTFLMEGAAHHLDLRQPNTCDPPPVKNARYQIVNILKCYAYGCANMPEAQKLPPFDEASSTGQNCAYVSQGYPWDQKPSEATTSTTVATTSSSTKTSLSALIYLYLCISLLIEHN